MSAALVVCKWTLIHDDDDDDDDDVRTLRIAFHDELMNDEHYCSLAILRVDVPLASPVCEIFVRMIWRFDVAATSSDVLYAPCTPAPAVSIYM